MRTGWQYWHGDGVVIFVKDADLHLALLAFVQVREGVDAEHEVAGVLAQHGIGRRVVRVVQ